MLLEREEIQLAEALGDAALDVAQDGAQHREVKAHLVLERRVQPAVLERQREREVRRKIAREELVALPDVAGRGERARRRRKTPAGRVRSIEIIGQTPGTAPCAATDSK